MRKDVFWLGLLLVGALVFGGARCVEAQTNDEQEIRALIQQLMAAAKAKNVNEIMSAYVADEQLMVFDVTPPLRFAGAKACRKDWEDFVAAFPGPIEVELGEPSVTADGTLVPCLASSLAVYSGDSSSSRGGYARAPV